MSRKFKGYISSRANGSGSFTPQRVQNLVIREYCHKNSAQFLLSATEYYMDESFLMLESLAKTGPVFDALVFYSITLLPKNNFYMNDILSRLVKKGIEVRFALEEIAIVELSDIDLLKDIKLVSDLRACDGSIQQLGDHLEST